MLASVEASVFEAPVSPAQPTTRTSVVPASIASIMAVHKLVALVAPLPMVIAAIPTPVPIVIAAPVAPSPIVVAPTVIPLSITVTTTSSLC